jgi:ubiquinone/menaquinone biosynthesis C-methylase UbiE
MTRYDTAGQTYTQTRRSDPRIAAVIDRALDGMSVANVGAGTGSYEPRSTVIAVEPSTVMLRQRSSRSAPAVQAVAEHIPIASRSVDAALAVLTVHHWTDWRRGVKEMTRIARRRVVIFTVDHSVFERFWLLDDYLPALRETDAQLMGFSTGSFKCLVSPALCQCLSRMTAGMGSAQRTGAGPTLTSMQRFAQAYRCSI